MPSLLLFHAIVAFEKFEKLFNSLVFFPFFDQLCHCYLGGLRKKFLDELFNLLIYYLVGNAEDLEASTDR